ncbi:MAG: hypothetical protein HOP19_26500, partial [Acidobacteria bacterium]|nr:hypothetical protein [Acidobacteriota bacterium]
PQQRDIDDGKGQMLRLQVFPNGDIQVLGKSPVPLIEGQRAASRERIAAGRNVTSRANNNTNNANRRQIAAQKLGSTGAGARKAFPAADVSALAQKWGVDEAEAKRRLEVSGYEVR